MVIRLRMILRVEDAGTTLCKVVGFHRPAYFCECPSSGTGGPFQNQRLIIGLESKSRLGGKERVLAAMRAGFAFLPRRSSIKT